MRLILATLFVLATVFASAASFTTQSFGTTIVLGPKGEMIVNEEISVNFTEPQRGLIRKLPIITRGNGNVRRTRYELDSVEADFGGGFAEEPARASVEGGDWQLRIGRREKTHSGPATYRISYHVFGALTSQSGGALGPRTELLWNVIPHGWATSIEQAVVQIAYPDASASTLRARVFSGPLGTKGSIDLLPGKSTPSDSRIEAELTKKVFLLKSRSPLAKGEGITVALALPEESVTAPPPEIVRDPLRDATKRFQRAFRWDWTGFALPFTILIPAVMWQRRRKIPVPAMVVQFDPPEGIGAAECGMIIDQTFDSRDVVAGMISLAQKKAATIRPDESVPPSFAVNLLPPGRAVGLTEFESELYAVLEPYGPLIDTSTLRGNFGNDFHRLQASLGSQLRARGILTGGGQAAGCFFALLLGLVAIVGGAILSRSMGIAAVVGAIVATVIALIVATKSSPLTREGMNVWNHVRGLREFIQRANADELRNMSRTMPAQALYERLLPYAIAFGSVKQWAAAFEGLDIAEPDWFESPYGGDHFWTGMMIANMLDSGNGWESAVTPPAMSSNWSSSDSTSYGSGSDYSSGGSSFDSSDSGSSGGGGGGGGGDSW